MSARDQRMEDLFNLNVLREHQADGNKLTPKQAARLAELEAKCGPAASPTTAS